LVPLQLPVRAIEPRSEPQDPRDTPADEPSQDSEKRQQNKEEKGENACPLSYFFAFSPRRSLPKSFAAYRQLQVEGSRPQHPRDPAASEPSEDSEKRQDNEDEEAGDSCSLAGVASR